MFVLPSLKVSTLSGLLSVVGKLNSKFDCSGLLSFRDVPFVMIFEIFSKIRLEFSLSWKFSKLWCGAVKVFSGRFYLPSQNDCSTPSPRYAVFMIFRKFSGLMTGVYQQLQMWRLS